MTILRCNRFTDGANGTWMCRSLDGHSFLLSYIETEHGNFSPTHLAISGNTVLLIDDCDMTVEDYNNFDVGDDGVEISTLDELVAWGLKDGWAQCDSNHASVLEKVVSELVP